MDEKPSMGTCQVCGGSRGRYGSRHLPEGATVAEWRATRESDPALGVEGAPRNTYVDFAVADDKVVEMSVTQENIAKAQTWLRDRGRILGVAFGIGERPKHADGRLRWRHAVMPGLPFLAARNVPRWFIAAYLIASRLRHAGASSRGPSPLFGAYPAWSASKIV